MTLLSLGMPRVRFTPPDAAERPAVPSLVDSFGRIARDLRISVTEKCSLRCTYCMPAEGLPLIPRSDLLTPSEIGRLVEIAVRDLGIREIRFTGGEPLVRKDLPEIVAQARAAAGRAGRPDLPLAMTTNGIGLDRRPTSSCERGSRASTCPWTPCTARRSRR